MSQAVEVADAVVHLLNAEAFSQSLTAERAWRPEYTPQDMETLKVIVIPVMIGITGNDRASDIHDYAVEIGIFKKIESDDPQHVDPWIEFVEEVADRLRDKGGLDDPKASFSTIENDPIVASEYLQKHIFASLLTVVFRLWR